MGGLKTMGAIFQEDWGLKGECRAEELNAWFHSNLPGGGARVGGSSDDQRDCDGNSQTLGRVLFCRNKELE